MTEYLVEPEFRIDKEFRKKNKQTKILIMRSEWDKTISSCKSYNFDEIIRLWNIL